MKRLLSTCVLIGCAASTSPPPAQPKPADIDQVWSVSSDKVDGGCPAVACEHDDPACGTGTVRFTPTPCLANARVWRIGRHAATRRCTVLAVERCLDGVASCEPATRDVECPRPSKVVATPGDRGDDPGATAQPDLAITAKANIERGRAALAAGHLDHATRYFQYVIDRFPDSSYIAEARAGLRDVEAKRKAL